ncbi:MULTISPECIES: tyrosine-protein phosphatase [unclassified Microbacterium]|uniref:tyrosine-protein phosphatase n=1 Tax=unclassified Microbacterium TaxID=2609290 RepID=UPI00300A09E4
MNLHDVPGAFNFRDVGGLPAGAGRTRSGVLFRSGNLGHLTAAGRERVAALGIRRVVDLRDDDERRSEPSRLDGLGIDTVHLPMYAGSVASFFDDDLSLADVYRALIDGSAARLVEAARAVLDVQPVLVHCTVGKDRTGLSVALVLAAAGVDEDAVIADYARTEQLLPLGRNESVLRFLRHRYPDARHLEDLVTRSPAAELRAVFEDLRLRYGGPVDYLQAHGLTEAEIGGLRRALVE